MTATIDIPSLENMHCCCCGGCTKGRQWWNRDDGYGFCERCADEQFPNVQDAELTRSYGVRGYHFDVKRNSQARHIGARLAQLPKMLTMFEAPSSVDHSLYKVGYFHDQSILIWAEYHGWLVLDEEQTYHRTTVEHLARCLGIYSRERIAEIVGDEDRWIDGIHWGSDGRFLGM